MDTFSQIDCMVAAGVMTQATADKYKTLMAHLTGLQTNDLLMFIAASQVQHLAAGSFSPTYVTGPAILEDGQDIMADTSAGPYTITLPISPTIGTRIEVFDAQSTFATNNLTIARNGELIDGSATDLIANLDNAHMTLIFNGGAQGWSVYNL